MNTSRVPRVHWPMSPWSLSLHRELTFWSCILNIQGERCLFGPLVFTLNDVTAPAPRKTAPLLGTPWKLIFRPTGHVTPTPAKVFLPSVRIRLFQTFMHSLETQDGIEWTIKSEGRILHSGKHAPDLAMAPVFLMLTHLQQMLTGKGTPAVVTCGRQAGDIATLQDLLDRRPGQTRVTSHLMRPSWGGVPRTQPRNKNYRR